ncbi:Membrane-bound lytic murein transglycosylase D [invertebrate metagenome]|uniref:Membrane-bound lytic murein transglycosylase D n=1 Tax=invertebrate metagenome TaxID=1711999 RepID=A0A2H9T725_9ZZZZ
MQESSVRQSSFISRISLFSTLLICLLVSGCQVSMETEQKTAPVPSVIGKQRPSNLPKTATEKKQISLWGEIRSGMALNLERKSGRIDKYLDWYQKYPLYFDHIIKRAEPYLYFIVQEVQSRNMPLELALMPVVESAFDPFAFSPAGAAGLWQIMPKTGEYMGLTQNWWYDGRRDIVLSTQAALDYMVKMYSRFGDWELALAAYNSGPGRVSRAIRKHKGKPNFWALDLPAETTDYVPKLIALSKIIQFPKKYGISLKPVDNKPYFSTVATGGQLDIATAEELSGITSEELYRLNPGLNQWLTPPDGPHRLLIPIEKTNHFSSKLTAYPKEKRVKWQRYIVKSGDNLGKLAQEFGTDIEIIRSFNKLTSDIIRIDQPLMIVMPPDSSVSMTSITTNQGKKRPPVLQEVTHTIKSGESLWLIAQEYDTAVKDLTRWNRLSANDVLHPGETLSVWISSGEDNRRDDIIRKVQYTVRDGDSLTVIADKFNIHVHDIKEWNTDARKDRYIHPGQNLVLYVKVRDNT